MLLLLLSLLSLHFFFRLHSAQLLLAKENYQKTYDDVYEKYERSNSELEKVKLKIEEIDRIEEEIRNLNQN